MSFKIVTQDAKRTTFHSNVQLDTKRNTGILIRQSKRGSDAEHYESRLLQESLIPFVMAARGEDDLTRIHIFDEGAGVSGRLGVDKRKKLRELHIEIEDDLIGDVVLARADRLFRDKHFANVSTFTQLAEKKKIKVIVPQTQGAIVYDFAVFNDLQNFQKDMQAAYAYVVNQIGYMNRARDYKMSRGFYGGGCIPLPYVLVRDMPKEEQAQVIYEPWREAALDLFQKFLQFNFEPGRIARYVEDKAYLFPFMPAEDLVEYLPVTNMHKGNKGYTFTRVKTILYYLSNLVLGGYAHGGKDESGTRLLIEGAFEAVIPRDVLEPCYAAIKGQYLDGTPFVKPHAARQYRRQGIETDAIAHGLMTSDDGAVSVFAQLDDDAPIYACCKGGYYGQRSRIGLDRILKAWTLNVKPFDCIIVDRLIALAEYDQSIVKRVQEYFSKLNPTGQSTLEVLDTAIHNTQKAIKRVSKTIVLLTKGNVDDAGEEIELDENDPIVIEKRGLQVTLRRLQKQREEAAREANEDPAKSITGFYYVLSHLRAEFGKLDPQTKKDIIKKLAEEIKVNSISPHLYTIHTNWIQPVAEGRDDVALMWRSDPIKDERLTAWTTQEEELLIELYPKAPQTEFMQVLPYKTPGQIKKRAWELGVKRDYWHIEDTERFYWTVSYKDLQIAAQYTDSAKERAFL